VEGPCDSVCGKSDLESSLGYVCRISEERVAGLASS
jgi:hypothetical protein